MIQTALPWSRCCKPRELEGSEAGLLPTRRRGHGSVVLFLALGLASCASGGGAWQPPQVWSLTPPDAPPLHTGGHKGQDISERTPHPRLSTDRTNTRNDQAPCPCHAERGPLPIPPLLRPRRSPRDNCASEPPPTPRCVPSRAAWRTGLTRPVPAWPWGQAVQHWGRVARAASDLLGCPA